MHNAAMGLSLIASTLLGCAQDPTDGTQDERGFAARGAGPVFAMPTAGAGTGATGGGGTGGIVMPEAGEGGTGAVAGSAGVGSTGGTGGTGGASVTGGTGGTGGDDSEPSCPLPDSFAWTSTGALATPESPPGANWVSLKDFSVVHDGSQYLVYATVFNKNSPNNGWQGVHLAFTDFAQMGAATQTFLPGVVAPTLFYFTPKNLWVLAYQWGFKYATSTDPANPNAWSATQSLLSGDPTVSDPPGTGPIDQTVICDDTDCYLFFAGDNGRVYRASMPIGQFPDTFSNAASILSDEKFKLFEAVQVYTVKGGEQYLMIVEAGDGGPRYFRAFTATSLGGTWTAMPQAASRATPFAGLNNVDFPGGQWTNDISHGDIVRMDPSEKQIIDPCNLQFLYQGFNPSYSGDYGSIPYRPGLLTLVP